MAITLTTDFQKRYGVNSQEFVYLVHLYTGDSTYLALATVSVVIGTTQYLACVSDFGQWSEMWKVDSDNGVTLGSPTITLGEYQTPDGYNIQDEFASTQFAGRRVVILMGYAGTALSDFATIFDGTIDDIEIKSGSIEISTRSKDLPETKIAGRELNYATQLVGADTYAAGGVIIHEDVDKKRLPVPFGRHWNSPLVCYDAQTNGESSWNCRDNDWWADVANADTGLLSFYREHLGAAKTRLLVEQEGKLVPYYPLNFNNEATYTLTLDARAENLPRIKIVAPASCTTTLEDQSILVEVPLRLRYDSTLAGDDPPTNPTYLFDGDADTYVEVTGTPTPGSTVVKTLYAWLEKNRQLTHGADCVAIGTHPIHVTQSEYGNEEWQALLFGRSERVAGSQTQYNVFLTAAATVCGTVNKTAGNSRWYRNNPNSAQYCFFSHLAIRDTDGNWNVYELSDPIATGYLITGVSDTGNYNCFESEGTLPYLGRDALDQPVKMLVTIGVGYPEGQSGELTGRFWDFVISAFETASVEPAKELYAELTVPVVCTAA